MITLARSSIEIYMTHNDDGIKNPHHREIYRTPTAYRFHASANDFITASV